MQNVILSENHQQLTSTRGLRHAREDAREDTAPQGCQRSLPRSQPDSNPLFFQFRNTISYLSAKRSHYQLRRLSRGQRGTESFLLKLLPKHTKHAESEERKKRREESWGGCLGEPCAWGARPQVRNLGSGLMLSKYINNFANHLR